jgi:hypothetical protein
MSLQDTLVMLCLYTMSKTLYDVCNATKGIGAKTELLWRCFVTFRTKYLLRATTRVCVGKDFVW